MSHSRGTDLHEVPAAGCRKCPAADRRQNTTALGFCEVVTGADGLPVKCVGNWAREKVWTIGQYVGIFADAMKDKFDLNYLEVCSGPGRCISRELAEEMDGTAMAVLKSHAMSHFSSLAFIDNDKDSVDILQKRIDKLGLSERASAFVGDYNNTATFEDALGHLKLNGRSLTLCVLDPYNCSMPFDVVQYIKQRVGKCDIIISYFDGLDAKRNFKTAVLENRKPELARFARFLGITDSQMREFITSREVGIALTKSDTSELMQLFSQQYENRLKSIGLSNLGHKAIRRDLDAGVEFYRLLFASSDECGLRFWNNIQVYTSSGQRQFAFMEG